MSIHRIWYPCKPIAYRFLFSAHFISELARKKWHRCCCVHSFEQKWKEEEIIHVFCSLYHQKCWPFELKGQVCRLICWSPYFGSFKTFSIPIANKKKNALYLSFLLYSGRFFSLLFLLFNDSFICIDFANNCVHTNRFGRVTQKIANVSLFSQWSTSHFRWQKWLACRLVGK